jgi:sugar (pentulose or hexulose) kinase
MVRALVALIDIGKTHSRIAFIDPESNEEIWSARHTNGRVESPLGLQLDVLAIEEWLIAQLNDAPHRERVSAIVPIAHGAAGVLIAADGEVVAAPDYEDARFEQMNRAYALERDAFDKTFSPSLPLGLNLGRQLFHLQRAEPQWFRRIAHVLLYPQYWAWRLSGRMASEVTSLGCHSDLWRPQEATFSELARSHDWVRLFPALRHAGDVLGPLSKEMVRATGLDPGCGVVCGIHDSNASYLQHLIQRPKGEAFAVISSGTWTVVLACGVDLTRLRADRDMLANVDAFGTPTATARFMGGREYEAIAGTRAQPDIESLLYIVQRGALALPAFAAGGPFAGRKPSLMHADGLSEPGRAALATGYVALMVDLILDDIGATGEAIVDGPLARNPLFARLLATLRPADRISVRPGQVGYAGAASYLAGFAQPGRTAQRRVAPFDSTALGATGAGRLQDYKTAWREMLGGAEGGDKRDRQN